MSGKVLFVIDLIMIACTYYLVSGRLAGNVYNILGHYTTASKVCVIGCGAIIAVGTIVAAGINLMFAIMSLTGRCED